MEGLQLFVRNWGAGSLVALFVLFIAVGVLETRWSVNKKLALLKASKDEALEREKYWRGTVEKLQATINLQAEQLGDMMEQTRTTLAILDSIESQAYSSRHGRRTNE